MNSINKISLLLNYHHKRELLIITVLLIVGMLFEIAGIGILVPALSILLDPNELKSVEIRNIIKSIRIIKLSKIKIDRQYLLVIKHVIKIYNNIEIFKRLFNLQRNKSK